MFIHQTYEVSGGILELADDQAKQLVS